MAGQLGLRSGLPNLRIAFWSPRSGEGMTEIARLVDSLKAQADSRVDLWAELLRALGIRSLAEIGVYRGEFAEQMLARCPAIESYLMIDPWRHLPEWNKPANQDDEAFERCYREALARTSFAADRITVFRETSLLATRQLADHTLDCAYIDGDHTLRGITIDLNSVYDKVAVNGLIGGDDFCASVWQHAASYEPTLVFPYAVHFAEAKGDHLYALPFQQFLLHKQVEHDFRFIDCTASYPVTALLHQLSPPVDQGTGVIRRGLSRIKGRLKAMISTPD